MNKQQRIERMNTLFKISGCAANKGINVTIPQLSDILDWLHRNEVTLHRLAEKECNEGLTDRDNRKISRIEKEVSDFLSLYGVGVRFNYDPRGGAIRMLLPDHSSNGWDGETWGIYW